MNSRTWRASGRKTYVGRMMRLLNWIIDRAEVNPLARILLWILAVPLFLLALLLGLLDFIVTKGSGKK
jgi:hypothetical protein